MLRAESWRRKSGRRGRDGDAAVVEAGMSRSAVRLQGAAVSSIPRRRDVHEARGRRGGRGATRGALASAAPRRRAASSRRARSRALLQFFSPPADTASPFAPSSRWKFPTRNGSWKVPARSRRMPSETGRVNGFL